VKFIRRRIDPSLTDLHARDHSLPRRALRCEDGELLAIEMDRLGPVWVPYSMYPAHQCARSTFKRSINYVGPAPYYPQNYTKGAVSGASLFQEPKDPPIEPVSLAVVGHPSAVANYRDPPDRGKGGAPARWKMGFRLGRFCGRRKKLGLPR